MEDFQTNDAQEIFLKVVEALNEPQRTSIPEYVEVEKASTQTPKKVVKPDDFVKNTLTRLMNKQKKAQQDEEVKQKLTKKPTINPTSKTMVGNQEPLHERVEKIVKAHEDGRKALVEKVTEERATKVDPELTFKPKIISKNPPKKDFYAYSTNWKEHKTVWDELRKLQKVKDEDKTLTFAPKLDEKSVKMFNNPKPSHERLLEWKKNTQEAQQYKSCLLYTSPSPRDS